MSNDDSMSETRRLEALRRQPAKHARPPSFWRSLDELAGRPAFQELLHREFPSASLGVASIRSAAATFLKLMGASLALAGVTACTRQPAEKIVPYVRQPEELIPGKPLFFATAMPLGGVATGLLVESHEGRPTKIEGNPLHPASLGATDVFAQAAILGLYDPDRSQTLTQPRRDPAVAGVPRRDARGADGAAAAQGRRPPHPHRVGHLADARRADPRSARALPVGEVASVGSGEPRQRARRREARVRRVRRRAVPLRAGRRHPLARRRLPRQRPGRAALRARLRRAPPARRRRAHEPALRRRDRCRPSTGAQGRSPPAAAGRARSQPSRARSRAASGVARRRQRGAGAAAATKWIAARREGSAGAPRRAASSSPATASRRPSTRSRTRSTRRSATSARPSSTRRPVEAAPVDQLASLRDLVADMNAGKVDLLRHPRRQSGLHRAGRSAVRRRARQGAAARPPQPLRRRDVGAVPLADSRGALPRSVERRARLRRHRRRSSSR